MKNLLLFLLPILSFAQQINKVDFTKVNAKLTIDSNERKVSGTVSYDFNVLKTIDTIRIDAVNMNFSDVVINSKSVNFKVSNKELKLFEGFNLGKNTLTFYYDAIPKQAMYFTGIDDGQQVWTQGQGRYTSNWFPSFDDVNEKVIFNMTIGFRNDFEVISNGILKQTTYNEKGNIKFHHFEMQNQMSSYLLMVAIGKFNHKTHFSKTKNPLENYYKPADEDKYQYTYKYSTEIFDYFEKEIGFNYPWKIYRQIPVEDFLYGGMENTTSTIFAQDYVVDESGYNDRNYINVNAHELAHQWFGDLITAKSGKHHWLQEGFATYYALLAERKIFGDDYFYNALYKNSLLLRQAEKSDTIPVMNEKASSLTFYQKGAWAVHVIREAIGPKKFQKVIKNYLKKYKFQNVETDNFLAEVRKVAKFDTENFKKIWLEDYRFPTQQANALLQKSSFYQKMSEINSYKNKSYAEKEAVFSEIMKSSAYFQLKKEIIYQVASVSFEEKQKLIQLAMQTNDIEVRQAVAETVKIIPTSFKSDYESLLDDKSYDTKQIAFLNLWKNFPDSQAVYLAKAENWIGKNDKELRITFLVLYQFFKQADADKKALYLKELIDYTSPKFESSIRKNALENALIIVPKDEVVLKNLVNGTIHPKWQFVKYSRDTIRELLKKENYRQLFQSVLLELSEPEKFQLQRLLDEK